MILRSRLLAGLLVLTTTETVAAQGAGPENGQGGVVCIDEHHNNRFTLDGRFAMASEIWRKDQFLPRSANFLFSRDSLRACNVLVIANALHQRNTEGLGELPTPSAFSPEEVDAVREWVEAGGGLLLLADHMPMPGAARDLAAAFGIRFTNGFALNPDDMSGQLVFRRSEGSLRSHAITDGWSAEGRLDSVVTYTGQAFLAEPQFAPLLVVPDGVVSFLPQVAWEFPDGTPQIPAGGWLQGAAANFGSGRVAVFGEAAQFRPDEDGSPRGQNGLLVRNVMLWLVGWGEDEP